MTSRRQVLIVEDNAINRELLCNILAEEYETLEAENGEEALAILRERKDEIALVLLDVIMPVMDGYTFLDIVKSDPGLSLIPVIVTTQSSSEADEVNALEHGATDFVPKPYRSQVILHRVASIINLRETAAMVNQFRFDSLTGLLNKEFFYQKVQEMLEEHKDRQYHMVCSNIENFKLYNDLFGVAAGDELLKRMAEKFSEVTGTHGICGRQAADHFMWLCEDAGMCSVARLNHFTEQLNQDAGSHVVIKWGVYKITDRSVPVDQMCDRAFLAAERIKGQYRNHVALYDDELRDKMLREQALTEIMETALKEEQFQVYLQPKYKVEGELLAGAEALVRWQHPELGFISPGDFIPLFEKNGFITQLDMYIWDKTCQILKGWEQKGYPAIPVSVNVSRADIYQIDLVDTMEHLVRKYELNPAVLHLEITESAYTENASQILSTVDELRRKGFVIEMDDFGSGYSSLNMLNQMKNDILKLDMKFIQSEIVKPVEQGILRFIIGLAKWMGLRVIAEGVETREQLERLKEIGCDYVQGYFFSKPVPVAAFEDLLQKAPVQAMETNRSLLCDDLHTQRILLVDEDVEYRNMVHRIFDGQFEVEEALCAEEVLEQMQKHKRGFSVIILSMTLPEEESARILETLGNFREAWKMPVLATAEEQEYSKMLEERAMRRGADDFAWKPHSEYALFKRVSRLIGLNASREREYQLESEACLDYETGLYNRRGLEMAAGKLCKDDLPLAVYVFELEGEKEHRKYKTDSEKASLNKRFSTLLKMHTRKGDLLAHYGGDGFIAVLKKIPSDEIAVKKGEEICRAFYEQQMEDGECVKCSVGITRCDSEELLSARMIRQADEALSCARKKKNGGCLMWREGVSCFDRLSC